MLSVRLAADLPPHCLVGRNVQESTCTPHSCVVGGRSACTRLSTTVPDTTNQKEDTRNEKQTNSNQGNELGGPICQNELLSLFVMILVFLVIDGSNLSWLNGAS